MSNRTSASEPVRASSRRNTPSRHTYSDQTSFPRRALFRAVLPGGLSKQAALLAGVSMAALLIATAPAGARALNGGGGNVVTPVSTATDAAVIGAQRAAAAGELGAGPALRQSLIDLAAISESIAAELPPPLVWGDGFNGR